MKHKIWLANTCLNISAIHYAVFGAVFFMLQAEISTVLVIVTVLFCVALIVGIEVVVVGIHHRKFWSWVAGLCIFGTYTPSLYFHLGALGLWGLLDHGSRAEFRIGLQQRAPPISPTRQR